MFSVKALEGCRAAIGGLLERVGITREVAVRVAHKDPSETWIIEKR
jgi:hypothetical protein